MRKTHVLENRRRPPVYDSVDVAFELFGWVACVSRQFRTGIHVRLKNKTDAIAASRNRCNGVDASLGDELQLGIDTKLFQPIERRLPNDPLLAVGTGRIAQLQTSSSSSPRAPSICCTTLSNTGFCSIADLDG